MTEEFENEVKPVLTKKHFGYLSGVLAETFKTLNTSNPKRREFMDAFASEIAEDHPRFDADRFKGEVEAKTILDKEVYKLLTS